MHFDRSLGSLNYIRVWHDNSDRDSSSSWFLKYIIVRDLQTMMKSYFICQKWLSVEKDDGLIERLLPVASDFEKQEMFYLLSKKAYYSLSDGHLWFSIFFRPVSTKFPRVERCTCCFVLLYNIMLLSILYYDQVNEAKNDNKSDGLSLGSFYFTREEIGVGLIVDILMFIPSILLVEFFRRIRQRHSPHEVSLVIEALSKFRSIEKVSSNIKEKKTKNSVSFPWWCLFIAYGLSFILIVVATFIIIVRGIEFGDIKIQKWLTSLTIGFFSSILLSQPIKVVCFAMFFACISRQMNRNKEATDFIDENEDFYLNGGIEQVQSVDNNAFVSEQRRTQASRLSKAEVAEARESRLREIRMWSFILEIVTNVMFLSFLYSISYANLNVNSYQQVHHLRNYFLNPHNSSHNYMKISTINEYWKWLEESFVENIRAQQWYNGEQHQYLSGFINDKCNRLIGWPIIRQLRVKINSSCRIPISVRRMIRLCKSEYSQVNEEHDSWTPEWMLSSNVSYSSSILDAFTYRSGNKLDSYDYVGEHAIYKNGGYVYEFRGRFDYLKENLTMLRELSWIDHRSSGILIQFTLYNPNIQFYTSVTLLVELLITGGVFPQGRFDPVYLHNKFQGFSSVSELTCGIIYMLFIVYFTIVEIRSLIKLKKNYFHSVWLFIEWTSGEHLVSKILKSWNR